MINSKSGPSSIRGSLVTFTRLLSVAGVSKWLAFVALCSIAISSLFQMVGLGLVIPVLNGLSESKRFAGLEHTPVLGQLLRNLPFADSDIRIFLFLMFLIFIAVAMENLFMFLGQLATSKIATDFVCDLRVKAFDRFLGFSKAFYDKHKVGELSALLTHVPTHVGTLVEQILRMAILVFFSLAFFSLMVAISWQMTLLAGILLPLTHFIATQIGRKIQASAREEIEVSLDYSSRAVDALSNISLVHLSGAELEEREKLTQMASEIRRHGFNVRKKRYLIPRVVDVVDSAGVLLVVCFGVYIYFSTGAESPGRFFVYFLSLRRFTSHLEQLSSVYSLCQEWLAYAEKMNWIFSEDDKLYTPNGSRPFAGVEQKIEFRAVSFSYTPEKEILSEISFVVPEGEIVALVGATGAGKTTLISLIPRFYDPSAGGIFVDGVDLRDYSLPELRGKVGVVSQDTLVLNDSIRANLTYGLRKIPSDPELKTALERAHLWDFIEKQPLALDSQVGTKGIKLSGGERQRLSIARAMLRDPEILILDEATSALDSETELRIQLALEELFRGRTVFVIAHRLSTVAKANQIIVLEKGKILEQGSPEVLLEKGGQFFKYWELQKGVIA